jgi:hypothetical protein
VGGSEISTIATNKPVYVLRRSVNRCLTDMLSMRLMRICGIEVGQRHVRTCVWGPATLDAVVEYWTLFVRWRYFEAQWGSRM